MTTPTRPAAAALLLAASALALSAAATAQEAADDPTATGTELSTPESQGGEADPAAAPEAEAPADASAPEPADPTADDATATGTELSTPESQGGEADPDAAPEAEEPTGPAGDDATATGIELSTPESQGGEADPAAAPEAQAPADAGAPEPADPAAGDAAATGTELSTPESQGGEADPAAAPDAAAPAGEEPALDAAPADAAPADAAPADDAPADAAPAGAATAEDPAGDGSAPGEVAEGEAAQPSAEMQAVLDKLAELGADPIGTLPPEEQRREPTPADAVMALMEERGIEPPEEVAAVTTRDVTYPAGDGSSLPARVYTPPGEGPFPLVVYYHGGGWVIATIDTYDASARALAAGADAVVVSVEYRKGPENPFPAGHEDADAAFAHFVETSGEINADSTRLAVAGESAGANLALNVAINARDAQLTPIDHVLLVYPVAGDEMDTPSYEAYAESPPLTRAAMTWFVENALPSPAEAADPRIDLKDRDDLAGLPPATIINAEIDVLQSEGEVLAQRLGEAGVEATQMTYGGVTHEFFGMGAVVPTAKEASDMAAAALREAFAAP